MANGEDAAGSLWQERSDRSKAVIHEIAGDVRPARKPFHRNFPSEFAELSIQVHVVSEGAWEQGSLRNRGDQ
jgi:hypothetical protein